MRSLADRYRDLFPSVITDVTLSGEGLPLYGWTELTPTAAGAYEIQPGARSGTTALNWARELEDHLVEVGSLVWMRHRDEDGQLHFEFVRPQGPQVLPPSSGASGPPPHCPECCPSGQCLEESLCLEIDSLSPGTRPLAGLYAVTYSAPLGEWVASAPAGGGLVTVRLGCASSGLPSGPAREMVFSVSLPGGAFDFVLDDCTLPWTSPTVTVTGGALLFRLREGRCDDCDQTVTGNVCIDGTINLRRFQELTVLTAVCPVFTEIDLGDFVRSSGPIRTDQAAAAGALGSVVGKLPIYDEAGALKGYLPLYDSIT